MICSLIINVKPELQLSKFVADCPFVKPCCCKYSVCDSLFSMLGVLFIYLILSDTFIEFHSQVFPSSSENAWLHTGKFGFLTSQRKTTMIFFPLKVSLQKKCPI